jgi:photosystem II stability/assembly factor-like uncharacterized protein
MDGTVQRSIDGGASWSTIDHSDIPRTNIFSILANPSGRIVIAGKGFCLYSLNAGTTWNPSAFNPKMDYSWIYGLAESESTTVWTVGEKGVVYRCDTLDQCRFSGDREDRK